MITDRFSAVVAVLLSPQGQAAIAADATGTVIHLVRRQAHRWTQQELADRSGYSQATISRVERGVSRAARDTAVLTDLADVLGVPPAVLGITSGPQQRPILEEVESRREVLGGATSLAVMALLPHNVATPSRIDAAEVTQCWSALHRLYQLGDQHGGGTVCQLTEGIARRLQDAVRRCSYSPEAGRELQKVTAATMEHAGWLSYDAGRPDKARHWWLETCHFADVHEVLDVRVTALASMALQACYAGDGQEILELVRAARKTAHDQDGNPLLLSLFAAREAVGHALLGDRRAAASAIGQAHQRLDHGRRGDEPFWLDFWGPADLAWHETRIALVTGQGKAAEIAARTALATVDVAAFPCNHTFYAAGLGSVLTQRGQFDEAISVLSEAIQGVHAVHGSGRTVASLHRTVDLLGQQKYPPATSFATAARRLLPTVT